VLEHRPGADAEGRARRGPRDAVGREAVVALPALQRTFGLRAEDAVCGNAERALQLLHAAAAMPDGRLGLGLGRVDQRRAERHRRHADEAEQRGERKAAWGGGAELELCRGSLAARVGAPARALPQLRIGEVARLGGQHLHGRDGRAGARPGTALVGALQRIRPNVMRSKVAIDRAQTHHLNLFDLFAYGVS
jgi:hypothetical protein